MKVASCKRGEAVGRQSLDTAAPRNASLRAFGDSYILILSKEDYQQTISVYLNQEKKGYISSICRMNVFKEFSFKTQDRLNTLMFGKFYYKNDSFIPFI